MGNKGSQCAKILDKSAVRGQVGSVQLKKIWEKFDKNGDGQLDGQEVRAFLQDLSVALGVAPDEATLLIESVIEAQVTPAGGTLNYARFVSLFEEMLKHQSGGGASERFQLTSSAQRPVLATTETKKKEKVKEEPILAQYGPPPSRLERLEKPQPHREPMALVTYGPRPAEPLLDSPKPAAKYGPPSVFGIEKPQPHREPMPQAAYGPRPAEPLVGPPKPHPGPPKPQPGPPNREPMPRPAYGPAEPLLGPPTPHPGPPKPSAKYGPPSAFGIGERIKQRLPSIAPAKPSEPEPVDYGPQPSDFVDDAVCYGPPSVFGLDELPTELNRLTIEPAKPIVSRRLPSIEPAKPTKPPVDYGPRPSDFNDVVPSGPPSDSDDDVLLSDQIPLAPPPTVRVASDLDEDSPEIDSNEDDKVVYAADGNDTRLGKTPLLAAISLRKEQLHLQQRLQSIGGGDNNNSDDDVRAQLDYYDELLENTGQRSAVVDKSVEELDEMTVATLLTFHDV